MLESFLIRLINVFIKKTLLNIAKFIRTAFVKEHRWLLLADPLIYFE